MFSTPQARATPPRPNPGPSGRPATATRYVLATTLDDPERYSVDEVAKQIARAATAIVAVVDPSVIVIGGSIGLRDELLAKTESESASESRPRSPKPAVRTGKGHGSPEPLAQP